MKNNHCFEDSARGDLLSQNPSLLYQYLASDVYPLTDAPFAEDVKTVDISSLFSEMEDSSQVCSMP